MSAAALCFRVCLWLALVPIVVLLVYLVCDALARLWPRRRSPSGTER